MTRIRNTAWPILSAVAACGIFALVHQRRTVRHRALEHQPAVPPRRPLGLEARRPEGHRAPAGLDLDRLEPRAARRGAALERHQERRPRAAPGEEGQGHPARVFARSG